MKAISLAADEDIPYDVRTKMIKTLTDMLQVMIIILRAKTQNFILNIKFYITNKII